LASGLTCPSTLLVDPISGDLFFGDTCFGAGADNPSIWRISNPASATPTMSVYATLPSTPTVGNPGFAPDGTLYVAYGLPLATAAIARIAGTNTASPGSLTTIPGITTGSGVSVVQAQPNGAAKGLLVTNGTNLLLVDITTNPFTSTVLATGSVNQNGSLLLSPGSVGPDGCLYFSSPDTVFRLAPTAGPCGFVPTNPAPSLNLLPTNVSPNPVQGTSANFTATLRNVSQPLGTPITFFVGGANSMVKMVRADINGQATFSYSGRYMGTDQLMAIAQLDSGSPSSNTAQVSWDAGRHMTFLGLNTSPTAGSAGQPATVTASLTDISSTPPVPIANANVTFTLGKSACPAVTDANGLASCMVIPAAGGLLSLNATFQGTPNYVGSTASVGFNARGQAGPPPAPKCPLTQTYWRTHFATWPVTSLMLGTQLYSEAELLNILNLPTPKGKKKGDASVLLGRELITAKLSIANGSDPTPVTAIVADADNLLSGFNGKLPYGVLSSSAVGKAMLHDEAVLVNFENGLLTPKCSRTR
jgi:hypothetical protein